MENLPEFISNHPWWIVSAVGVIALIIINEWLIRTRGFTAISSAELVQKLNKGAKVLDIRSEKAFKEGHILNSVNMSSDKIADALKKLKDKNQDIVVCCQTGVTCNRVAKELTKDGYTQVSTLRGGIQAWISDKMPIS